MYVPLHEVLEAAGRMAANNSARLCLDDACKLAVEGNLDAAFSRAVMSIKHSVGILHPIFKELGLEPK